MVNWRTGAKEELLSSETSNKICPLMDRHSMFVGRTGKFKANFPIAGDTISGVSSYIFFISPCNFHLSIFKDSKKVLF